MVLYSCMLIQRCMGMYGCMAPGGRRDKAWYMYGAIQLYWFKGWFDLSVISADES